MEDEDSAEGRKAKYFRLRGNHYFNIQDFDKALHCYKMGITFDATNSVLYSNMSQAHLALQLYILAENDAKKAIELDNDNVKGYFRAAKAAMGRGDPTKAIQYLHNGLKRSSLAHNSELKNYLDELLANTTREKICESSINADDEPSIFSTPTTPIKTKNKDSVESEKTREIKEKSSVNEHSKTKVNKGIIESRQNESTKTSEIKAKAVATEPAQSSNKSKGKTGATESKPNEPNKTSNKNSESKTSTSKVKGRTGPIESKDISEDRFLQTVETAMPLHAPTQVQKRKKVLEFFATVGDGSELLLKGLTKTAATKYTVALDILAEYPAQCLDLGRMEEILLKYAISWCWLRGKDNQSIAKAIEYLVVIRDKCAPQFPAVYYALGNTYFKLNRFHNASKFLEKGLNVIKKKHEIDPFNWPGSTTQIKETTAEGLQDSIMELLPACKQFHPPDAICKYDKETCLSLSNQIVPSESIYFSDPDFVGFVVIICQMKCKIQYHLACWKDLKENESDATGGKVSDKDMLGWSCPTDDCVTATYDRSVIVAIQVIGENGVIKSQCEREPVKPKVDTGDPISKDAKKTKKKTEKVKSTTTTTTSEKEKPRLKPRQPPVEKKAASPARTLVKPPTSASLKPRVTMDLDDEEGLDDLEVGRDSDELIIQRTHLKQLETVRNYNREIWQPMEAYYGREDLDPDMWFMTKSADACQDFIFSFFYDFLNKEGPQPVSEIEERWESEKDDCEQYRDLAGRDDFPGIINYLSDSYHFVVVNDYIGTCAQAPDVFELATTDITDCFEFLIKDYAPVAKPPVVEKSATQMPRAGEVAPRQWHMPELKAPDLIPQARFANASKPAEENTTQKPRAAEVAPKQRHVPEPKAPDHVPQARFANASKPAEENATQKPRAAEMVPKQWHVPEPKAPDHVPQARFVSASKPAEESATQKPRAAEVAPKQRHVPEPKAPDHVPQARFANASKPAEESGTQKPRAAEVAPKQRHVPEPKAPDHVPQARFTNASKPAEESATQKPRAAEVALKQRHVPEPKAPDHVPQARFANVSKLVEERGAKDAHTEPFVFSGGSAMKTEVGSPKKAKEAGKQRTKGEEENRVEVPPPSKTAKETGDSVSQQATKKVTKNSGKGDVVPSLGNVDRSSPLTDVGSASVKQEQHVEQVTSEQRATTKVADGNSGRSEKPKDPPVQTSDSSKKTSLPVENIPDKHEGSSEAEKPLKDEPKEAFAVPAGPAIIKTEVATCESVGDCEEKPGQSEDVSEVSAHANVDDIAEFVPGNRASSPAASLKSECSSNSSYRSFRVDGQDLTSDTETTSVDIPPAKEIQWSVKASEFKPRSLDGCLYPPPPMLITNPFWEDKSIVTCPAMFRDPLAPPLVATPSLPAEEIFTLNATEPLDAFDAVETEPSDGFAAVKTEPSGGFAAVKTEPSDAFVAVKTEPPESNLEPASRSEDELDAILSRGADLLSQMKDRLYQGVLMQSPPEVESVVTPAVETHKTEILSDSKTCQTELTTTDIEELIHEWDNSNKMRSEIAVVAKPAVDTAEQDCQTDLNSASLDQVYFKLERLQEDNKALAARMKSADEVTLILLDVRKKVDAENHQLREENTALTGLGDELARDKAKLLQTNQELVEMYNKLRDDKTAADVELAGSQEVVEQGRQKYTFYKDKYFASSQEIKTLKALHLKLVTELAEMKVSECDEKYRVMLAKLQDAKRVPDLDPERRDRLTQLHARLLGQHRRASVANNEAMARYAELRQNPEGADLAELPRVAGADVGPEYQGAVCDLDPPAGPCCDHRCGEAALQIDLPLGPHFHPKEGATYVFRAPKERPNQTNGSEVLPPHPQQRATPPSFGFQPRPPTNMWGHTNYPNVYPQHPYTMQMPPQFQPQPPPMGYPLNMMHNSLRHVQMGGGPAGRHHAYSGQPVFTAYQPAGAIPPPSATALPIKVDIKNPNLINELFGEKTGDGAKQGDGQNGGGDRSRSNSVEEDRRGAGPRDPKSAHSLPKLQNVVPIDRDAKDFARLLEELKKRHPLHSLAELQKCVETVRDRDHSLSGMPFSKINTLITNELEERAKAKKNAWGQVKTDVNSWKPEKVEEDCVICMDKMNREKSHTLDCHHTFHQQCIKLWLGRNSVCPMCNRHSMMSDDYPPLK